MNNDCKYMKIIYAHCREEINVGDPRRKFQPKKQAKFEL